MNPPRRRRRFTNTVWNPRRIYPSYNDFGKPEYVDQDGREYRLATDLESPYRRHAPLKRRRQTNMTVLFVRIPKTRRKRNASTGRLPPRHQQQRQHPRWPKRRIHLFNPSTQHTASASVYSVETRNPRSAVAKIKVRYWNVSEHSVNDPSMYLNWW